MQLLLWFKRISSELLLFMVYRFHSELKEASPHIQDILSSVVKILLEKFVLTWGVHFKHHSDLEIHFTGYALQQVCAVWLVLKYFTVLVVCCYLVTKPCLILCNSIDCSMPGFFVLHYMLEFAQTHVHWVYHLILYWHLLLLPSIFPSIRVFSNELTIYIKWQKYWSFSLRISLSSEIFFFFLVFTKKIQWIFRIYFL